MTFFFVYFYLRFADGLKEEVVEEQIHQSRILVEGGLYVAEETGANNAPATPHQRYGTKIEFPVELFAGFGQKHKSLRIADNFWSVESLN